MRVLNEGGNMNLNDLRKIDKQITQLKTLHQQHRLDFIKENCPHSLGDSIVVEGYSFKGKKMILGKISVIKGWSYNDDPAPYKYQYGGYLLKMDGTPGKIYTRFEVAIKEEI
jgi:hypothetical protein